MKKNSKMFMALMVVLVTIISAVTLVGCVPSMPTTAIQLVGAEREHYAFAVNKGNTTMREALNEFIESTVTVELVETSLDFHSGSSEDHIEYPDLSQYEDNGEIIMLTNAFFPPYEYMNNTSVGSVGGVAGVDVDLMMLFAASQEKTLKVVNTSFDSIIVDLTAETKGNMVAAAALTITTVRATKVDFSKTYTDSIQFIISEDINAYSEWSDLEGLVIGVQEGTTADIIILDAMKDADDTNKAGVLFGKGVELKRYKSAVDAYLDLENGRLNAIMIDEKVALNLVAKNN